MQNEIITERLTLNLLNLRDHHFIKRLVNSNGWIEFIGDRNVHTTDDAIAYINKITNTPDLFYWVVRIKDAHTPIGITSFMKRAFLESFDIGFAFLPEFNGRGYAYEASREILSIVSQKAQYGPILATTVPRNVNSIKLLKKLGLRFEREMEVENETLHIYSNLTPTKSIP
jgi:RimJ/RimL family protein N-acetyltransferase